MPRNSRNWSAIEGTDFAGGNRKLEVEAVVETRSTNERLTLVEAIPQGTVHENLILELVVTREGVGNEVIGETDVKFEKPVSKSEYTSVSVRGGDIKEREIKVEIRIS